MPIPVVINNHSKRFKLHESIRIRNCGQEYQQKLEGEIGRVSGFDRKDPEKLYIQFDNEDISKWLPETTSLPSSWMEPLESANPKLELELMELLVKLSSLFINAADKGDLRLLKSLHTQNGMDVNKCLNPGDGMTALHFACKKGHKDVVQWLIYEAHADLEKQDNSGFRAIHHAVSYRSEPEVLEILLKKGAQTESCDEAGKTASFIATANQFTDCLNLLIQYGADVNGGTQEKLANTPLYNAIRSKKASSVIQALISSGRINWEIRDNERRLNILHVAVIVGDLKAIEWILENCNIYHLFLLEWMGTKYQHTVLHYICSFGNVRNFGVAKLMIDRLKSGPALILKQFLDSKNDAGLTALLIACSLQDYALIELLVESGADVKATDADGNTAIIHLANSFSNKNEMPYYKCLPILDMLSQCWELGPDDIMYAIRYLWEKGCDWKATDKNGNEASEILRSKGVKPTFLIALDMMVLTDGLEDSQVDGRTLAELFSSAGQSITSTLRSIRQLDKDEQDDHEPPNPVKQKSSAIRGKGPIEDARLVESPALLAEPGSSKGKRSNGEELPSEESILKRGRLN